MVGMFFLGLVVGVVLTIVVILVIGLSVGHVEDVDGEEEEHVHDWRIRGAQQMYNVQTYHGIPIQPTEEGAPITKVLYRCEECAVVETETMEGHWTLKQLADDAAEEEEQEEPLPAPTAVALEFCGLESLHAAHEYDGKHCPGSLIDIPPVKQPVNPDPTNILPRDNSVDPTRIMG